MSEIIRPLKKLPVKFKVPGDYNKTTCSIFLGILSNEECTITNYNRGKDIFELIEFFESYGYQISRNATEIKIYPSSEAGFPECAEMELKCGVMPLTLLIGLVIGKKIDCTIHYGDEINQDLIDRVIGYVNKRGIDLFHDADEKTIVFRAGALSPMECRIGSALPYLKNLFLMAGLSSGISVLLKEDVVTSGDLEWCLREFNSAAEIKEIKSRWVTDPVDPRKKVLESEAEWKREIKIGRSQKIPGGNIEILSDRDSSAALIELICLKKGMAKIVNIHLNEELRNLIKLLGSAGIDINRENTRSEGENRITDLIIKSKRPKPRKISGVNAVGMIEQIPFIALIMARAEGTTIIRDVGEYATWAKSPFVEISTGLEKLGVKSGAIEDGLIIEGGKDLDSDKYGPFQNRVNALAFYIAALAGKAKSEFESLDLVKAHYGELLNEIAESSEDQVMSYIRS